MRLLRSYNVDQADIKFKRVFKMNVYVFGFEFGFVGRHHYRRHHHHFHYNQLAETFIHYPLAICISSRLFRCVLNLICVHVTMDENRNSSFSFSQPIRFIYG